MSTMKADRCKKGRQPMSSPQIVSLFLLWVSFIFCNISYPLLHNLVVLDWRVVEFCLITLLSLKKREYYLEDSSSRDTFNALDTCRISVGLVSDKGVASSFARFSTYIYVASSSFSPFHPCWFSREKARHFWFRQFVLYFHHFIRHQP